MANEPLTFDYVEGGPIYIKFCYKNWRGNYHEYVIEPKTVEFGYYHGDVNGDDEGPMWLLHGELLTRDGDERTDMGDRRRSFIVGKIDELERVHQA